MVYVEPPATDGQPRCRLRADRADELHRFAVSHQLTADYQPSPGDPDGGVYWLTPVERQQAIRAGAAEATWLQVHERLRRDTPDSDGAPSAGKPSTVAVVILAVLGAVGLGSLLLVVGVIAAVGRATPPAAAGPAGVRSIEAARTEIDQLATAATPARAFTHEALNPVRCHSGGGTGGVLRSTAQGPGATSDAARLLEALPGRGWTNTHGSITAATGKFDGTADAPDGHAHITVFASDFGRAPAFVEITTSVEC